MALPSFAAVMRCTSPLLTVFFEPRWRGRLAEDSRSDCSVVKRLVAERRSSVVIDGLPRGGPFDAGRAHTLPAGGGNLHERDIGGNRCRPGVGWRTRVAHSW